MRKIILITIVFALLVVPVSALDLSPPDAPVSAREFMPKSQENLGQGILEVFRDCMFYFRPDIKEAGRSCIAVLAVCILYGILQTVSASEKNTFALAAVCSVSLILLQSANSLIRLGLDTVSEISEYAKLFFPVMAAALAAQGGMTTSAQLYAGTVIFDTVLCNVISEILHPAVFLFLFSSIACSAIPNKSLKSMKDFVKASVIWINKSVLLLFTGYIGITGVISGAADSAAIKAAKLTISGVIPVVGNILSDASEAVLVSASAIKNSIGVYGFFAVLAVWLRPFLQIGTHYLVLKITGNLCAVMDGKDLSELVGSFADAMGMILAMTGATCIMLIVSIVCFMKGVG